MVDNLYKCSYIVDKLSTKYDANKTWIWDLLADEFNMIKGLGCVMTKEEAEELEKMVIDGMNADII